MEAQDFETKSQDSEAVLANESGKELDYHLLPLSLTSQKNKTTD